MACRRRHHTAGPGLAQLAAPAPGTAHGGHAATVSPELRFHSARSRHPGAAASPGRTSVHAPARLWTRRWTPWRCRLLLRAGSPPCRVASASGCSLPASSRRFGGRPAHACCCWTSPPRRLTWRSSSRVLDHAWALAREGVTVVAVMHDLNMVSRYASRVLALHQGQLVADTTPRRFHAQPAPARGVRGARGGRTLADRPPAGGTDGAAGRPRGASESHGSTTQGKQAVLCHLRPAQSTFPEPQPKEISP
jgi:hypothetical protein